MSRSFNSIRAKNLRKNNISILVFCFIGRSNDTHQKSVSGRSPRIHTTTRHVYFNCILTLNKDDNNDEHRIFNMTLFLYHISQTRNRFFSHFARVPLSLSHSIACRSHSFWLLSFGYRSFVYHFCCIAVPHLTSYLRMSVLQFIYSHIRFFVCLFLRCCLVHTHFFCIFIPWHCNNVWNVCAFTRKI